MPSFSLSDQNKERLRRFDDSRPYLHRAAMFALPAMAVGNYLVPASLAQHKHKILAGLGTAGAAAGLLDRKIEHLAEEHEELRPMLKSYSKAPVPPVTPAPMAKAASAMTRVARNREELTEMFPSTMASRVGGLQKEALNINPEAVGQGLQRGLRFIRQGGAHVPASLVGGAVGAIGGAASADPGHGLGGAVKGGLLGAGAGFGASKGLQMAARTAPVHRVMTGAARGLQAAGSAPVTMGQAYSAARGGITQGLERGAQADALLAQRAAARAQPATQPAVQSAVVEPPKTASALALLKKANMDTTQEIERPISGRAPFATLSSAAEISNDAVINQLLRGLYANTDAMRKATEEQVLAAFPMSGPHSYGRHRAIGRTADDIKAEIALGYTPKR